MKKIKISILLSTYNEEKFIKKTIKEIFKHIKNSEIIIVDDNSTDNTIKIIKNLKFKNLKLYVRKNRGLASAFLLALINSSGDKIGWVDSNMNTLIKKFPLEIALKGTFFLWSLALIILFVLLFFNKKNKNMNTCYNICLQLVFFKTIFFAYTGFFETRYIVNLIPLIEILIILAFNQALRKSK